MIALGLFLTQTYTFAFKQYIFEAALITMIAYEAVHIVCFASVRILQLGYGILGSRWDWKMKRRRAPCAQESASARS